MVSCLVYAQLHAAEVYGRAAESRNQRLAEIAVHGVRHAGAEVLCKDKNVVQGNRCVPKCNSVDGKL